MKKELTHYILLGKRLLLSLVIFELCRFVFLVYNYPAFRAFPKTTLAATFLFGLRFDISTLFYLNSILIILHILPFQFRNTNAYQRLLWIVFVTFHAAALAFEFGDTAYFTFSHKRLTIDFFGVLGDFKEQVHTYLLTFWPFVFLFIATVVALSRAYKRWTWIKEKTRQRFFIQLLLIFPTVGLFILGARGGVQLKPISPITSLQYVDASLSTLVFNTCFSMGTSYQMKGLEEKNYFTDLVAIETQFNTLHCYRNDTLPHQKKNVVVIILESFSKSFVGSLSHEKGSYTPFLDSLINSKQAYVATNGYANARHSHEGNVAVLASIPALMVDPFISSIYQSNSVTSFASVLKKQGYHTSFFHGANNGSMTLDLFTKSCGFDHYYGRNEYPDQKDYDGNWGIYDDKFLNFYAHSLGSFPQPFASAVFTLSSHFPYAMPDQYKSMFPPEGNDPMYPMVRYTDHSLKQFFEEAKKQSWYSNTLFVICADHTFGEMSTNNTYLSKFSIPILFFDPGDTQKKTALEFPVQQVDIVPSILDYLHVPDTFRCFGNSVFDPNTPHCAFNHEQGFFQIVEDDALLQFDGTKTIGFFDLKNDPLMKENQINSKDPRIGKLTLRIEAVIQTYNEAMIRDKLH